VAEPGQVASQSALILGGAGSRVLTVGCGMYSAESALPSIPAAASTLDDLGSILADRCGLSTDRLRVMTDPGAPAEVGLALAAEAEQAADVLVFYYVGHGLVSEDGQLYLATRMTVSDQSRLRYTALAYADVRKTLLDSPARSLVVLLDCCFSGRATGGVLGDELGEVGSLTEIHGGFVLTAAGRSEPAFAPPGQRHTAFTGQLLRLLVDGHPDAPPHWTLHDMHRFLARELVALGLSRPQCRAFGRVGELVLASNLAWRAPASENAQQTLDDPGSRQRAVTVEGVCPYKGLAAFQQGDARWFFGRERLTATVVQRMASTYDDPGGLFSGYPEEV
jgi:Novel STAND NTPase 1/Caspase domain